jgi:hypothetical protein
VGGRPARDHSTDVDSLARV